jgi:hypothetical protein
MANRYWVGLVVAALLALAGCDGAEQAGGAGEGPAEDGGSRDLDGRFEELPSLVDSGGEPDHDAGSDAATNDSSVDETDAAVEGDGGAQPGDAGCSDDDSDGVCNEQDVCSGHDDALDNDADEVPNGCDGCPVGGASQCDTVIWSLELSNPSNVSDDQSTWSVGFLLRDGSEVDGFAVDVPIDDTNFVVEMDADQLDAVRAAMSTAASLQGNVSIASVDETGVLHANGPTLPCPFDPHRARLSRVVATGRLVSPDDGPFLGEIGTVRFDFRGYVDPS